MIIIYVLALKIIFLYVLILPEVPLLLLLFGLWPFVNTHVFSAYMLSIVH